jgi:hypothetical protein
VDRRPPIAITMQARSGAHHARDPAPSLATNDLDAFWMPFTPNRRFKASPRMLSRAEGMHYFTPDGRRILDATSGLWCVNAGHNRPEDRRGDPPPGRRDGLRPQLQHGPSGGLRLRQPHRPDHPAGPGPHLLHRLGLGVGRHRPEDRPGLSPGPRQGDQDPADRPRARLSRRRLRRHLGGRHPQEPDVFRLAADRRRPPAPHPRRGRQPVLARACPRTAPSWPTRWKPSSPCTTPPTSPP